MAAAHHMRRHLRQRLIELVLVLVLLADGTDRLIGHRDPEDPSPFLGRPFGFDDCDGFTDRGIHCRPCEMMSEAREASE